MKHRDDDPNTWRTRSGEPILIKDLDDDHLINVVRLIGRADVRELRRLLGFAADLREATDSFWATRVLADDLGTHRLLPPPPDVVRTRAVLEGSDRQVLLHLVPQITALEAEVQRRGLQP